VSNETAITPPEPNLLGLRTFDAMNTDVRIVTLAPEVDELMALAEQVFHDTERRFSRFQPESELSRLNSRTADQVRVSPEMMAALRLCTRMHLATGGVFDPAILPALEHAGYDESFERIPVDRGRASDSPPPRRSINEVNLKESRLTVKAPRDLRLDFGGIGKGLAVDGARAVLAPLGDFVIDAGGDILASGNGPDGDGWLVAVGDPRQPGGELARVTIRNEAIATSSVVRRRWRRGGAEMHHIIDPRRGEPAETECVSVSVIAPTAVEADVYAKCALILGVSAGRTLLEARHYDGLFALRDGSIKMTRRWRNGR
jgi:thiamine biosynthesis lipoprotein